MRILLVKTSSMGDVIHNLPVATDLARRFPEATIDWCVEESFAEIPRLHPAVCDVVPVAIRRWRRQLFARDTWRRALHEIGALRRRLRDGSYDYVLDTQGLVKSALIVRQAGGVRCGYAAEAAREPLAARFYDATFTIPKNAHAVDRNRWLAAAAFGYPPDLPLDYGIAAAPLAAPWLPAGPYATLLTATSRDDKLWPEADWIELGRALAERGVAAVLPGGSPAERERATRIAAAIPGAVVAPPQGLAVLASLIAGSRIAVGVDTGLSHLAAALVVPTLAIYTATDPGLTGVLGCGRHRNLGGRDSPPTAAEAVAAATEWLD